MKVIKGIVGYVGIFLPLPYLGVRKFPEFYKRVELSMWVAGYIYQNLPIFEILEYIRIPLIPSWSFHVLLRSLIWNHSAQAKHSP